MERTEFATKELMVAGVGVSRQLPQYPCTIPIRSAPVICLNFFDKSPSFPGWVDWNVVLKSEIWARPKPHEEHSPYSVNSL